jgi:hypothetical protein
MESYNLVKQEKEKNPSFLYMTSTNLKSTYHVIFILNIIVFTTVSMLAVVAPNGKCGNGLVQVPRLRLTPHARTSKEV